MKTISDKIVIFELFAIALKFGLSYSIKYVDYLDDEWTVPVILTWERYDKLRKDASISEIKLIANIKIK